MIMLLEKKQKKKPIRFSTRANVTAVSQLATSFASLTMVPYYQATLVPQRG